MGGEDSVQEWLPWEGRTVCRSGCRGRGGQCAGVAAVGGVVCRSGRCCMWEGQCAEVAAVGVCRSQGCSQDSGGGRGSHDP